MEQKRNNSFDVLKFICAIMIIIIHVDGVWPLANFIVPTCRCAVPCFMMISGFFLYQCNYETSIGGGKMRKAIKKMSWLCLWSTILYAVLVLPFQIFVNNDISSLSIRSLLRFAILNEHPWGGHLWYIFAYLYTLLFFYTMIKLKLIKYVFFVIPILLLCSLLLGKYSILFFSRTYDVAYFRNFIGIGIPCVGTGLLLAKHKRRILAIQHNVINILLILFTITSYIEYLMLKKYNIVGAGDLYVSSVFLAILLVIKTTQLNSSESLFSRLGQKYSMYIYVFHIAVAILFYKINTINSGVWTNVIYPWLSPFLIFGCTMSFILVLHYLKIDRILK